jgi:hypothetical protein
MRLVLAHEHDVAARGLADRWGDDAVLLTPGDLHDERMLLRIASNGTAQAEIPSRPEVTSVLTRLGGVGPSDLHHVDPRDLDYAAAELDAFLRAWLEAWGGPVVNRPSTTCLNGPGWRPEHWAVAASALGLGVRPVHRTAPAEDSGERVTVVGDRCFGQVSTYLRGQLCELAAAVGCRTLEAVLDGETVLRLSAWPDVAVPDVADALAGVLDGTP